MYTTKTKSLEIPLLEFFAKWFEVMSTLKLYHYTVISGFKHEKTDFAFSKCLDLGDKFLEVAQGKQGRMKPKG